MNHCYQMTGTKEGSSDYGFSRLRFISWRRAYAMQASLTPRAEQRTMKCRRQRRRRRHCWKSGEGDLWQNARTHTKNGKRMRCHMTIERPLYGHVFFNVRRRRERNAGTNQNNSWWCITSRKNVGSSHVRNESGSGRYSLSKQKRKITNEERSIWMQIVGK